MVVLSYKTAPIKEQEELEIPMQLEMLSAVSPSISASNSNLHTATTSGIDVLSSITDNSNNANSTTNISSKESEEKQNSMKEALQKNAVALQQVLAKKANNLCADALNLLLKKPWDPFSPVVHHTKVKKLFCSPVFLYIPCVSPANSPNTAKRYKNFMTMFGVMGKVSQIVYK
jgi:hypothetical protein